MAVGEDKWQMKWNKHDVMVLITSLSLLTMEGCKYIKQKIPRGWGKLLHCNSLKNERKLQMYDFKLCDF